MTPSVLRLLAPCKFNLYLDVLSRRPDGYHEVITVMEPLDLADVLVLEPAGAGITVTADRDDVPDGPGNLAYRGLELLRRRLGVAAGIRVSIGK
ncbi:MAG TPA: 4-(cytidine 5'-diphospho)-2-C-methyl-D-erythritol kinase, partial [bacterium]|nr:4-(cytidine 5'-diphospho)-2-C-methyl-D-erythritol kinase [bacterium]